MIPVLVDGKPQAAVSARDRGLQFGDGLFETIVVRDGRLLLLERHLRRLQEGATVLGLDLPLVTLGQELKWVASRLGTGVVKLIVTRGSGSRGYAIPRPVQPRRIIYNAPMPAVPPEVALMVCTTRLAAGGNLAGLKHLNRLEQVLGRMEVDRVEGFDDGIMLDPESNVIETTSANLFVVSGQKLTTPLLELCGVAGVMRGKVIELINEIHLPCEQSRVSVEQLQDADEVFITNSIIGIVPVTRIDQQSYARGPVTRKLQAQLSATGEMQ